MECTTSRTRRAGLVFLLAAALSVPAPGASDTGTWGVGDLFVAVGDGGYRVFTPDGAVKQQLRSDAGGYTADCAFDPGMERLFTANYTRSLVEVYGGSAKPVLLDAIDAGSVSPGGHSTSITFDAEGSLYVGHSDGNAWIHKYSEDGVLLATYRVETEHRGSNWLDLAADQHTLFYTSQGRRVLRFDVRTGAQLEAFAVLPGSGSAQSLRLLPPGDGSAGLLVADGGDIKRLDGTGQVVRTYDVAGHDAFFAINLHPDGRSFWAADSDTDGLFRFDLDSGRLLGGFSAGGGNSVYGLCVRGEPTAAVPRAGATLPGTFALAQNVPNPFNPSTQIHYALPAPGSAQLSVYNTLGQRIRTLVTGTVEAGAHTVSWDGRDDDGRQVSSGVYLYRFESAGVVETRRMLLLR